MAAGMPVKSGGVAVSVRLQFGKQPQDRECIQLFQQLKAAALPASGVTDDLLEMPHSVLQKIRPGGRPGLQRLVAGTVDNTDNRDVATLVARARERFSALDAVPCAFIAADITGCRLPRRRDR